MYNEEINLARYSEVVPEPAAEQRLLLPALADTMLLGLGGFGGDSAVRATALCARDGSMPVTYTLDNAASARVAPQLPGGLALAELLAEGSHLYLDSGDRRAALLDHPLLDERYRRLLRGHWAAGSTRGGNGGGAVPLNTMIDLDLEIVRVRAWLRGALQRAAGPLNAAGGVLAELAARQEQARGSIFALLIAGGSGSCGAGASQLLGYLLRQEARKLRLGRPTIWLLLAGPSAFKGLTTRTMINYGATVQALQYGAQHGINREGIDGETLREGDAGYDRVWLIDDPRLPGDGTKVSDREQELFSWRVAAAARSLLQPQVRAAYLDHVANDGAADADWPGFGTLQIGQGGFSPELLREQLAAELAQRRAAALVHGLAAA